MHLSVAEFLLVSLVIFASSIVQGAVGFAAGLIAIPLLVLMGVGLPEAIAINLVAGLIHSLSGSWHLRRDAPWRESIVPLGLRMACILPGIYVLLWTGNLAQQQVKQIVGVVLLAIVTSLWFGRVRPREHVPVFWTAVAFCTSGFIAGFCGMGGPMVVLWVMAHRWTAAKSRAFMFVAILTAVPLQSALLVWMVGRSILPAFGIGLATVPFSFAGAAVGLRLGGKLPIEALRRVTFAILVLIAVGAVLSPLVSVGSAHAVADEPPAADN